MEEEKFLTAREVARTMKIAQSTAYKLMQEGKIPGVKRVGRNVRVRKDIFEEWCNEV